MANATVIYDSDCGFCKWCLAVLLSAARRGAFRPLPLGTAEADQLLAHLTVAERSASWHLVIDAPARPIAAKLPRPASPVGADPSRPLRLSAGAALAPAMDLVRGGRLPAALFRRFPGATERGYRWVVDHRTPLGRFVPGRARRWAGRVIAAHGGPPQ